MYRRVARAGEAEAARNIRPAGSLYAFSYWSSTTFGPLRPEKMLRIVIPAILTFVLGCQTILSSFFLSVLGMRVRRTPRDYAKTVR